MGRAVCVVAAEGLDVAVEGSARSVGLVFSDALRHGERAAWLKSAAGAGMVGFDVGVEWEIAEVDHVEG